MHNTMKRSVHAALCVGGLALASCSSDGSVVAATDAPAPANRGDYPAGVTGMAISHTVDPDTDVMRVRYEITRVACTAGEEFEPLTRNAESAIHDFDLPGDVTDFQTGPIDATGTHQFADHYEVLPVGCYDVNAQPLMEGGVNSEDCASAFANGVEVEDGMTTEVFLVSQCKGAELGGLDAVLALNKPPQVDQLTFAPSKFVQAGQASMVCATASDPNGDPMEIEWIQVSGQGATPAEASSEQQNGTITECVNITPSKPGTSWYEVRIYDLFRGANGELTRVETWLRDEGYPNDSHDSLKFTIHAARAADGNGNGGAGGDDENGGAGGDDENGEPDEQP